MRRLSSEALIRPNRAGFLTYSFDDQRLLIASIADETQAHSTLVPTHDVRDDSDNGSPT